MINEDDGWYFEQEKFIEWILTATKSVWYLHTIRNEKVQTWLVREICWILYLSLELNLIIACYESKQGYFKQKMYTVKIHEMMVTTLRRIKQAYIYVFDRFLANSGGSGLEQ